MISIAVSEIQGFRLSRFITPIHYSIAIQPAFKQDIFYGKTLVYVYTKTTLDEFILHSRNLSITETFINGKKASVRYDNYEMLSVSYENETIQPGLHYIFFNYTGIFNEAGGGFIKAPFGYEDEDV